MNILYRGRYKKRFNAILACISSTEKSVVELCFGDTYIASECRRRGIKWTGYDISHYFAKRARNKGFDSHVQDISGKPEFSDSDLCIISGSLYYFHLDFEKIFSGILKSVKRIIVSEPVRNLSSKESMVGRFSGKMSDVGKGSVEFRFTEKSIIELLESLKTKLNFTYKVISVERDVLIIVEKADFDKLTRTTGST